jgi:Ca2+-binding EF-hand superfamily protein
MRSAFNALDREGGGYILEGELRGLLTSLGDALTSGEVTSDFLFSLFFFITDHFSL